MVVASLPSSKPVSARTRPADGMTFAPEAASADGDAVKVGKAARKLSGHGSKSDGRRRLICVPMFLAEGIDGKRSSAAATAADIAELLTD